MPRRTPGPSLMSDGTTIHTDYCYKLLDGDAYNASESWYSSPDNPALAEHYANQTPPRADGCVGPAAVCGYYDDAGTPIWFDKLTLESSPRYYDENGNPTMNPPQN